MSYCSVSATTILKRLAVIFLVASGLPLGTPASSPEMNPKQDRSGIQEDAEDYFAKWLKEDVVYIISEEEKSVFAGLTTADEKEQFIEQFWLRRDPDPRTMENEFKEEHYRRIALANERFKSGLPGWQVDRGRVYIIHGPPAEIESHAAGGMYERPHSEGGGSTVTFPFEVWRYRFIEGIGTDVVIEFVDPTMSGEYRLALLPEEKDALLHVPGAGLTLLESMGLASKADRPYFRPGNPDYPFQSSRYADRPFTRYETYVQLQRATPIKYGDLKSLVEVDVRFDELPFSHRVDYFRLNQDRAIVPLTVEIENRELTFAPQGDSTRALVAVYGIVTSLSNRVIDEFETELVADAGRRQARSAFQKILVLERKGRYKLDLVIKDLNSGKTGVRRMVIVPPPPRDELSASSVLLAREVRQVPEAPDGDEMFVLGDLRIRPSLDKVFRPADHLHVYLQVYNAALDQTTMRPVLKTRFELRRDGQSLASQEEEDGESIQLLSSQRVVLVRHLPLNQLAPGSYEVLVRVEDRIQNSEVEVSDQFKVTSPPQP